MRLLEMVSPAIQRINRLNVTIDNDYDIMIQHVTSCNLYIMFYRIISFGALSYAIHQPIDSLGPSLIFFAPSHRYM